MIFTKNEQELELEEVTESEEVIEIDLIEISDGEPATDSSDEDYLEISETSENKIIVLFKDALDRAVRYFKIKKHAIIGASAAALVTVTAVAVVVVANMKPAKNNKSSDEPEQVVEVVEEPTVVVAESKPAAKSLYIEAVADENTITAKVIGEDGNALSGHELVVNLLKGSKEDNAEQIGRLKDTHVGQKIEDVELTAYPDDDKDGTVLMEDLDTGVYTLVVQAEQGFKVPDAVETTVEAFQFMEDIMDIVVEDSAETQQEDPTRRGGAISSPTVPPTYNKDTGVKTLKMDNGQIVYDLKNSSKVMITDAEAANYTEGTILVSKDGANVSYKGFIYEKGNIEVSDGNKEVITKFLVLDTDPDVQIKPTEAETQAPTVAPTEAATKAETETATAPEGGTVAPTEAPTEAPTTVPGKRYILMEVSAQIEMIYGEGWQVVGNNKYFFEDGKPVTGWRNFDGMQYYFKEDGKLGSSLMIDVSTYNGDIDWKAVKAAGIDYAIIRVGYRGYETARLVKDKRFDQNMRDANAADVKVGAYIVTQAVNTAEAVEEASFIISACSGYNISLPLAIDVELSGNGSGRGNFISRDERTAVINAFAQTVANSGYQPLLYANKDWMLNWINAGDVNCPVWLAQYYKECTYGGSYCMWQFTDGGSIDGISGSVDVSAWIH